jgi:sugar phosphate isomerase/epimerase
MVLSLFPKFLAHLSVPQLAAGVRDAGLDTVNLVVRDGYWVGRASFARDLPEFMRAARREGLDVRFATAGFTAEEVINQPSLAARLAEHGIRDFRIDYFRYTPGCDPRRAFDEARRKMAQVASVCASHKIRAVYQVHHRMLISSAWSAWELVRDLPPDAVGVELDPGNQSFEGFEAWEKSARLLGEHFVATGVKDSRVWRDEAGTDGPDKRWRRAWCPIDEGVTDWHDFLAACAAVGFDGTFVFMPFYDPQDPPAQLAKLKREVTYFRNVLAQAREKRCPTSS